MFAVVYAVILAASLGLSVFEVAVLFLFRESFPPVSNVLSMLLIAFFFVLSLVKLLSLLVLVLEHRRQRDFALDSTDAWQVVESDAQSVRHQILILACIDIVLVLYILHDTCAAAYRVFDRTGDPAI